MNEVSAEAFDRALDARIAQAIARERFIAAATMLATAELAGEDEPITETYLRVAPLVLEAMGTNSPLETLNLVDVVAAVVEAAA